MLRLKSLAICLFCATLSCRVTAEDISLAEVSGKSTAFARSFTNLVPHEVDDVFYGCEYTVSTNLISVTWDPPLGDVIPSWYEVRLVTADRHPVTVYNLGSTTNLTYLIERPGSGHFVFEVRSAVSNGQTVSRSPWASSTNELFSMNYLGTNGAWRIFWKLPKIDEIIFE
jgi:hypothetical protein